MFNDRDQAASLGNKELLPWSASLGFTLHSSAFEMDVSNSQSTERLTSNVSISQTGWVMLVEGGKCPPDNTSAPDSDQAMKSFVVNTFKTHFELAPAHYHKSCLAGINNR